MGDTIFDGNFDEDHFNESLKKYDLVFVKTVRIHGNSVHIHVAKRAPTLEELEVSTMGLMEPRFEVVSKSYEEK